MVKNAHVNAGDVGLIPGLRRFPGRRNGNPLQDSCLDNSMDRGAWQDSPWRCRVRSGLTHTHTHTQPNMTKQIGRISTITFLNATVDAAFHVGTLASKEAKKGHCPDGQWVTKSH